MIAKLEILIKNHYFCYLKKLIMPKYKIISLATEAIKTLYDSNFDGNQLVIQPTREGIEGDFTLLVFPIAKISKKNPVETAKEIGEYVVNHTDIFSKYEVIKGFLNFTLKKSYWSTFLNSNIYNNDYGYSKEYSGKTILIEFSSPNTNKPLHLGHVRNNLIGASISNMLIAVGYNVIKVNLVNDRGIHICKSMLAWQKWGQGATPASTGQKGDHFVGDYYVKFNDKYKEEVDELINNGMDEKEAEEQAPVMKEAHDMLQKWEAGNKEVLDLWKMMNSWVYKGFDITYRRMGIQFDKVYYESQTYLLGKKNVNEALDKGIATKDPDNSVWIDLTDEGLDRKLLLRKDGTSVYITQDIGTAILRHEDFSPDKMIYVVGDEQIYHFDVLKLTLEKFGYEWAKTIYHLAYGMVELTTGKMKSREGTVVDADDLMDSMKSTANEMIGELGKVEAGTQQADELAEMVSMAALKYFILKIDPKKNMVFNPKDSIDFNGNTGPFIQYTYARIFSILFKAKDTGLINSLSDIKFKKIPDSFDNYNEYEIKILKMIHDYPETILKAANDYSPAQIANYSYELSKSYNQYYQSTNILKEENSELRNIRLIISFFVSKIIKNSMNLLGIEVPTRM